MACALVDGMISTGFSFGHTVIDQLRKAEFLSHVLPLEHLMKVICAYPCARVARLIPMILAYAFVILVLVQGDHATLGTTKQRTNHDI